MTGKKINKYTQSALEYLLPLTSLRLYVMHIHKRIADGEVGEIHTACKMFYKSIYKWNGWCEYFYPIINVFPPKVT